MRAAVRRAVAVANASDIVVVPDLTGSVDWTPFVRDVEVIVHLAGLVHADSNEPFELFDRINRVATQELASAAARAGIERFVFISSIRAQSGPSAPDEVTEKDEPRPTDAYGRSKLAAETAVRAAAVPFTIFRPVVIYGPNAKGNVRTITRLATSPFPLPFGAFANRRSMLSIDNFVDAVLHVLRESATVNETYVVADAEPISLRDIFGTLRSALNRRPRLLAVPPTLIEILLKAMNCGDVWGRIGTDLVVNPSKLMSTGWRPIVSAQRGLAAMVQVSPRVAA